MSFGHPLLWLALVTFFAVVAFGAWSLISTRRRHKQGPDVAGPGNRADPMVGDEADTSTPYMQQESGNQPGERVREARASRGR